MNERIKQLILKAGFHPFVRGEQILFDISTEENLKEFAELIIRECLGDLKDRIARRYQGDEKDKNIGYGMEIVYWEIVDKFGVEG